MKFFTIIFAILLSPVLSSGTHSGQLIDNSTPTSVIRQGNTQIVKEEYLKNIQNTGDAVCLRGLGRLGSSKNFITLSEAKAKLREQEAIISTLEHQKSQLLEQNHLLNKRQSHEEDLLSQVSDLDQLLKGQRQEQRHLERNYQLLLDQERTNLIVHSRKLTRVLEELKELKGNLRGT